MQHSIDRIRFYHYVSGVLSTQSDDPLCSTCKAFENTVRLMQKELEALDYARTVTLPPEVIALLEKASTVISSIQVPEDAEGQKKAGNCKMPKGLCFVKSSSAILKNMEG